MHRTQIYFEEDLFDEIKKTASKMDISVSAYIRSTLKKELEINKQQSETVDFSGFSGLWEDHDITQQDIRKKAWK